MTAMAINRIVLFGSSGWVGSLLLKYFRTDQGLDVVAVDERIHTYQQIVDIVQTHQPSHVVCAMGRTCMPSDADGLSLGFEPGIPMVLPPKDKTDSGLQQTIDELQSSAAVFRNCFDNILLPQWIACACAKLGIHMSYFGTGCIYHYDEDHPVGGTADWGENSPPNFAGSNYSAVKCITDQFFHQAFSQEVLNIRIRLPIVPEAQPRNLLVKILRYDQLYDIPNAYTYLPAFWDILKECMEKKITGSVNFVHREPVKLGQLYEIMIKELQLTQMPRCVNLGLSSLGVGMKALRSQNSIQPTRLEQDLGLTVPDGLKMLSAALKNLPEEEKEKFRELEKDRLKRGKEQQPSLKFM